MARQLCTLADVKAYIGEDSTAYDPLLERLIDAASEKFIKKAGQREFVVDGANPQTRVFEITRPVVDDRELEIGDLKAWPAVAITLKEPDGSVAEVVDLATVVALPRRRESWQPIAALKFVRGLPTSALLVRGHTCEVRGDWGFPAVPPNVVQEVIKTVVAWFARDGKTFSKLFRDAQGAAGSGSPNVTIGQHELPLSAQQEAESWRIPVIGGDDD